MKKILILLVGAIASLCVFFFYWDFLLMNIELPDRREDVLGVVRSVELNRITFSPWDMTLHPFKNLSLPEMIHEFRLMDEDEKIVIRDIMQKKSLPEIVIEIPEGQHIYKRLKQESVRVKRMDVSDIKENSIIVLWWDQAADSSQKNITHVMIIPPELRVFMGK